MPMTVLFTVLFPSCRSSSKFICHHLRTEPALLIGFSGVQGLSSWFVWKVVTDPEYKYRRVNFNKKLIKK